MQKSIILDYFIQNFTKRALISLAFGRKTNLWKSYEKILKVCNENSIPKLAFYLVLETLMLKIEQSVVP